MAPRLVEAFDAAGRAEEVLGGAGAEAVGGERVAAAQQLEILMRDDDVEEAGHRADRAIAIERGNRRPRHFGLEPHCPAMTSARNLHAAEDFSWWRKYFPHQNLNAYMGFGWLFHNSSYFARPDNTGRALFRYVAHADFDLYKNRLVLYGDVNFFTDRELSNKLRPTELDWIVGLAFRFKDDYEISVYREQDLSLDKPGTLIQEYWAVQLRFAFDVPKRMFARTP